MTARIEPADSGLAGASHPRCCPHRSRVGLWLAVLVASACSSGGMTDPDPEVVSVEVRLDAPVLRAVGIGARADAQVLDAAGSVIPRMDVAVTWSSGDTAVAVVDQAGRIESRGNGETVIRARAADVVGTATLVVDESGAAEDRFGSIAIVGATVVPMGTERSLPEQTVVIRGETIVEAGPKAVVSVPSDAFVIDGSGLWVMPGLADMHTHIATETAESAGPGELFMYAANGVTTVLNQGDFGGPLPSWASRILEREMIGPTLYLAKYARGENDGFPLNVQVSGEGAARSYVRTAAQQGYQYIKVYNYTGAAEFHAMVDEARGLGLSVIGHIPQTVGTVDALAGGLRMVAHAGFGGFLTSWPFNGQNNRSAIPAAVSLARDNGTWVNATLAVEAAVADVWGGDEAAMSAVYRQEGVRYAHPSTVALWNRKMVTQRLFNPAGALPGQRDATLVFIEDLVRGFHDAGVPLLIGSDSPTVLLMAGFSIFRELRLFEDLGLTPYEVLRTATKGAGDFVAATIPGEAPFGMVAPGQRADLLVLRSDPLLDLENVRDRAGIVLRGRWLSETRLAQLLDALSGDGTF